MLVLATATLALAVHSPCQAWPWSKTIEVWIDDTHGGKVTVRKVKPSEIARRFALPALPLPLSVGPVGVTLKWRRDRRVQYDEAAKELIGRLRELCNDFNRGKLSLEGYQHRLRGLYGARDKGLRTRIEWFLATRQEAQRSHDDLQRMMGEPVRERVENGKSEVEKAVEDLMRAAEALPITAPEVSRPHHKAKDGKRPQPDAAQLARDAFDERLSEFKQAVTDSDQEAKAPSESTEGMQDVTETLSLQATVFGLGVGPKKEWTLKTANRYDRLTQMLIVRYRQSRMDRDAQLITPEEYAQRLKLLYEAEHRAHELRRCLFESVRLEAEEALEELRQRTGRGKSAVEMDLDRFGQRAREATRKETQSKAKALLDALEADLLKAGPTKAEEMIEVWKDDAHTQKIKVPRLNTDLIASRVRRELTFRVSVYNLGPELSWATDRGVDYDYAVQVLIIKYKQLCMDYNAGLISQESYRRRREEIESAVARARRVREAMHRLARALAREAFDELDDATRRPAGR